MNSKIYISLLVEQAIMSSAVDFQPSQIVCLEHQETRLYAEVIQIVESRQVAWVRPLMLVVSLSNQLDYEPFTFYDLRQGADLLWPSNLFRPALDTEVLPLFTHLQISKNQGENQQLAHQQLQRFIRQVWQDYEGK
ncbi:hypothetical protein [[Phormidium] sp. LEGE 05292]|uniref:hypothetical protein n=1 Tax=[Phormidium] sp. LEGE 05292 TaxID=767427 RepID=UPI001D137E28|nr:hypothetical protein [Phormidium sp. LEGE 05292]